MTISAGERTTRVVFERGVATTDDYGGESLAWGVVATVQAKVLYGTGQERRQAAQEGSDQPSTVMVHWTPALASIGAKDRASFDGTVWDIASPPARVGHNDELHFSATRAA